jgi:hypothetical protein
VHKLTRPRNILSLLIAVVGWGVCGTCYADTIIGGASAGFQTWTAADVNNNNAPYWDYPTNYASPPLVNGNVGFCLTTGCAGQLSPGPPPGAIPFWGLSYNQFTDTGGALDPQFFFQRAAPETLKATLEVSLAKFGETNNFGWFETNNTGSIIGATHQLFSATDALGTTTTFQPTQFFGYYYQDISENCFVFTLSLANTGICGPTGSEPKHEFAAFALNPTSTGTAFWLAGLDHNLECTPGGGADCNLTVVEVEAQAVPEPTTALLLATGCMGLLFVKRVRRRNRDGRST